MARPEMDEDFINFESKVDQIMKLLDDISSASKPDAETGKAEAPKKAIEFDEKNCIVTVRENRTVINKKRESADKKRMPDQSEMSKFTFMQQMEKDAEKRAEALRQRERIAQNFRSLGNEAFRKQQYEKAILFYTKAIDHIKDSPILYNNRALSYLKLKNFQRGIMDCDYVLNKLDEKNLRSWLYRAAGFKRLKDEYNYESSIMFAKNHNCKATDYIENFVEKLKADLF